MRAVVQRVSTASVSVAGDVVASIERGLLVLVGVAKDDGAADVELIAAKIRDLRIFGDAAGKMNLNISDAGGEILVVSQFTLYADCRRGRRPAFDEAASPERARVLYQGVAGHLTGYGLRVQTGVFGATMTVTLANEGPVTLLLDSRRQF